MPLDKQAHFLAGAVIALALGYILPIVYGLAVAVIADWANSGFLGSFTLSK